MRVLLASESYWPNIDGGAVAQHNLALRLAERGHEVAVVAPGNRFENYVEEDCGTTVFRQRALTFPPYDVYKVTLFPHHNVGKVFKAFRPDVVHAHNPYQVGRAALHFSKAFSVPIVGSNHLQPENLLMSVSRFRSLYSPLKSVGWRFIVDYYNRCDAVVSPTRTAVDLLVGAGLRVPAQPISNGIDLERFSPKNHGEYLRDKLGLPDKPIVLYAGRLSGEKHLEVLLRAVPRVVWECGAHFVLVGSGRERGNLVALAGSLGIEESVSFTGFLDAADFQNVYALADVFAIPSEAELQSIVTLEAIASGLPVVATNKDALPELVHDGKNGFLFEPGDSGALADRLIALLSDPLLRKRFGRESRRIAEPHSIERVVSSFEGVYASVLRS
ncbi:MAG: glycosyltransferase [Candidatus Diapherotrites archaeon]|nr:glycosyltransferase [Candidatus Diapherotrites archaeon]